MAAVQGTRDGGEGDHSVGMRVQWARGARKHGQDAEAADARRYRQGLRYAVRVALSSIDYDLLPLHLVRHEHDLLWADAQHERVWHQRLFDFGECRADLDVLYLNVYRLCFGCIKALAGLVEIPAIAVAIFIIMKVGKKWILCSTFVGTGLACMLVAVVDSYQSEVMWMKISLLMLGIYE